MEDEELVNQQGWGMGQEKKEKMFLEWKEEHVWLAGNRLACGMLDEPSLGGAGDAVRCREAQDLTWIFRSL